MSISEVARLRQRIEAEITASRLALDGPASVARHEIITHHYESLSIHLDELAEKVGREAALEAVIAALEVNL